METTPPTCARHPEVTTRLRCSACDTPICPDCGREAAVGFKCPECAAQEDGVTSRRSSSGGGLLERVRRGSGPRASSSSSAGPLPTALGVRATLAAVVAAALGGAVLGPVLQGGAFFLIGSGVVGWGVARTVYWAIDERNSPYVRSLALVAAGLSVAVGIGVASTFVGGRGTEIAVLAYPAALYGGWIVVRQR